MSLITGTVSLGARLVFTSVLVVGLQLKPIDAPRETVARSSDGRFAIELAPGWYGVTLGMVPTWLIEVPAGGVWEIGGLVMRDLTVAVPEAGNAGALTQLASDVAMAVKRTGDRMTGPLILSGSPDSGSPALQAASRDYVDRNINRKEFQFLSPVATAPCVHNYGRTPGSVEVLTLDRKKLGGVYYEHTDLNTTTVYFLASRACLVICKL